MRILIAVFVISTLLLQGFASIPPIYAQQQEIPFNFDLEIITSSSSTRTAIVNYIAASLRPLGINVILNSQPIFQFGISIFEFENYDAWFAAWVHGPDRLGVFPIGDVPRFDILNNRSVFKGFVANTNRWDLAQNLDGTSLDDFNDLIGELSNTIAFGEYSQKVNEIAKLWMDKLLWYIPLIDIQGFVFSPKMLDTTNLAQGWLKAIMLGMKWLDTPPSGNSDVLNMPSSIYGAWTYLPMVSWPQSSTLVNIDQNLLPHPDIAIQWERSDWVVNDSLTIAGGAHKFILREDAYWVQSLPSKFNNISSGIYPVTPKDFGLAFDMEKAFYSPQHKVPWWESFATDPLQRSHFSLFSHYTINDTENSITFYNKNPSFMDIYLLSRLRPQPNVALNISMDAFDPFRGLFANGTPYELLEQGVHPYYSDNYLEYFNEIFGSGPYILDIDDKDLYRQSSLNPYYYYPNEWDSPDGDFIVHQPGIEEAYFNTFNATQANPKQKPTEYFFTIINSTNSPGEYYEGDLETGVVDILSTLNHPFDPADLIPFLENDNFNQMGIKLRGSGQLLAFNFLGNEVIQKFNVRKAIALAIDKDGLIDALGGFASPQNSIVFTSQDEFYSNEFAIPYDYNLARDLMRSEGYQALDTNEFSPPVLEGSVRTLTVKQDELPLQIEFMILPIIFLLGRRKISTRRSK